MEATIDGATFEKPEVQLTGGDGNVFLVIGKTVKALRRVEQTLAPGAPTAQAAYQAKAIAAKSYDEVLRLTMQYAEVE